MTEIKEKKVALVTGGARGIGRAICIALAKSDFSIVVNFNSSEKEANKTVDTIKGLNQEALALKADIVFPASPFCVCVPEPLNLL